MNTTGVPDLQFTIEGVEVLRKAVAPHVAFKLRIDEAGPRRVHSILLGCEIFLEPARRRYSVEEQAGLTEIFGGAELWARTQTRMLWTKTSVVVPAFSEATIVDVPVACTFDFNIAVAKYCATLEDGEIPVAFFFSGTVFCAGDAGVEAGRISWDSEAAYRLPVRVWREMREAYYPDARWLCLRRDAFERLYAYKVRHGLPSFEHALEKMMAITATTE